MKKKVDSQARECEDGVSTGLQYGQIPSVGPHEAKGRGMPDLNRGVGNRERRLVVWWVDVGPEVHSRNDRGERVSCTVIRDRSLSMASQLHNRSPPRRERLTVQTEA